MGVPKFFRWISERYPCLSDLVKEHQIPDFDNLYLDMNGIIHTCSHPNDHDPHFRISEEKICKDVFHYIEILFHMIKPQKLFFMAVDGVAPRAKQNQQRGRRFRTAKDAEMTEKRAKDKGEDLPDTARFDSNCITPGTLFMTNLQEELKLYVARKITMDPEWQKCQVILSGHETPGEGEHKIMDYIRYIKSKPNYDPNTRHCLYGLDADLIMLGLCSHEPHFALLREEVKFGKGDHDKRISTPEEITFYLLHLSLMREYLEMEFSSIKAKLPFAFDLESIIDDWVLMGFLVGNDFIPPLPDMHINEGALPKLYKVYCDVLPTLDGYINEKGTLNLKRFQTYMEKLSEFDILQFSENYVDLVYFQAKTGRKPPNSRARHSHKTKSKLIEELPDDDELDVKPKSQELASLIQSSVTLDDENSDVLPSDDSDLDNPDSIMMAEFRQHKNNYYTNKLEYEVVTPEVMREQAECYVRAIQWILNYYYNGVCSWSWFYPHHYAPYISDVKDFASLKLEYKMGSPFLPFQQLLAVLPSASKELLPVAFQHLMVSDDSPIIDFYPLEFSTDMNGKKQEWEALVLIPFIDETMLLSAMEACSHQMTEEERKRNTHGPMCVFTYSLDDLGMFPGTKYNAAFSPNHAKLQMVNREDICVEKSKLVKGLCPNINLNTFIPGFPTFKHIPYCCNYLKKGVKVFESPSRGENAIVRISKSAPQDIEELATKLLGINIYVHWPHLVEAKVISVSTCEVCYTLDQVTDGENTGTTAPTAHPLPAPDIKTWNQERVAIAETYLKRRGVDIGETSVIVRARLCIGRSYVFKPEGEVEYVKQWAEVPSSFVLQATVFDLPVYDRTVVKFRTMSEVFPVGTKCFLISQGGEVATLVIGNYGQMGEVIEGAKARRVKVKFPIACEPDLSRAQQLSQTAITQFMHGSQAGSHLGINAHLLSRITGNIFVTPDQDSPTECGSPRKVNIGLHLKYSSKNEQIPGYTRRDVNGPTWLYSMKAVELLHAYLETFPDVSNYLANHPSSDEILSSELFPTNPERLNEVMSWLKSQEYSQIAPQACGAETLDAQVVNVIEELVAENRRTVPRYQRMQVKPHLLFTPDLSNGVQPPDPTTTFRLFDRVINCRRSYSVPLGLKGVIIGISKTGNDVLYDVVFDEPFSGGLTLNCSEQRGYRVPGYSLINISHGMRMEMGEQAQPKANSFAPQHSAFTPVPNHRPMVPNATVFNTLAVTGPLSIHEPSKMPGRVKSNGQPSSSPSPWRTKQEFENGPTDHRNNANNQKKDEAFTILARPTKSINEENRNAGSTTDFKALWGGLENKKQNSPSPQPEPQDASTALRQMLRIDGETPGGSQNTQEQPVQQFFKQFSQQPPAVATNVKPTEATKSACGQLLSLFQARNLGTPRYCYVENYNDGTFQATVKLPDGRAFTGDFGPTKEKASEFAALKALETLRVEPSFVPPSPPAQWCATSAPPPLMSQVNFLNGNKPTHVVRSAPPSSNTSLKRSDQTQQSSSLTDNMKTVQSLGKTFMPTFGPPAHPAMPTMSTTHQFSQSPNQSLQFAHPTMQVLTPLMAHLVQPPQQVPQFAAQAAQQPSTQTSPMPPFAQAKKTIVQQQAPTQVPFMQQVRQPNPQPTSYHQFPHNQTTLIQQQVPTQMAFMPQQQTQQGQYVLPYPPQIPHMQQMFPPRPGMGQPQLFPGPIQQPFPMQQMHPKPFSQLQARMQHSLCVQQANMQKNQQTNGSWRSDTSLSQPSPFVPLQAVKHQRKDTTPPKQPPPKQEELIEVKPSPPVIKPVPVASSETVVDGSPPPVISVSRRICANFPGVKKKKK